MASVPSPIASHLPGPAVAKEKSSAGKLTDNFDSFLSLLTTQLKNQDPLSPMDAQTFTQQLVQFTSVEQSIKTNDSLDQLIALVQGTRQTSSMQYLGSTVEATSDHISLGASTPAPVIYRLPSTATGVSVRILDMAGNLVAETRGPTSSGLHEISWDGSRTDGSKAPAGVYRAAIQATGADGKTLAVEQMLRGVVDSIDPSAEVPTLTVGGIDVALSDVTSISRPR